LLQYQSGLVLLVHESIEIMKIEKGNYEGASGFAYFDRDVRAMSEKEMRVLLQCILHQAMPGEDFADNVYEALKRAEASARESAAGI
jgi:hypothetical protein